MDEYIQTILVPSREHPTSVWFYHWFNLSHRDIDVFFHERPDRTAAKRFFKKLFMSNQCNPIKIVADKLGSYRAVHQELIPDTIHYFSQTNNRAKLSHQTTRVRGMWTFKSVLQAQRFLTYHHPLHCARSMHISIIMLYLTYITWM